MWKKVTTLSQFASLQYKVTEVKWRNRMKILGRADEHVTPSFFFFFGVYRQPASI